MGTVNKAACGKLVTVILSYKWNIKNTHLLCKKCIYSLLTIEKAETLFMHKNQTKTQPIVIISCMPIWKMKTHLWLAV